VEAILDSADKASALDDVATPPTDAGYYQEALKTVMRIRNLDASAWALARALVRTGRRCDEHALIDAQNSSSNDFSGVCLKMSPRALANGGGPKPPLLLQ
jgi:hypothetical protein